MKLKLKMKKIPAKHKKKNVSWRDIRIKRQKEMIKESLESVHKTYKKMNTSREIMSIYNLIELLGHKPEVLKEALMDYNPDNVQYVINKLRNQPEWNPIKVGS